MWYARADDGFILGGLGRVQVGTLRGVPMLLETTDERVRQRLLPETYEDEEAEAQWREHATPELERLFMSRTQVVRKDLGKLRQLKGADSWVLPIPDMHVNAWLACLNAARLALYALNDLKPKHMERDVGAGTAKQLEAIDRIHFLAELQCVLMGDFAIDDEEDDEDEASGWSIESFDSCEVDPFHRPTSTGKDDEADQQESEGEA
jgi:hypothetical protein